LWRSEHAPIIEENMAVEEEGIIKVEGSLVEAILSALGRRDS